MAPQELIGRYRDYKSKTKNLVYWISQTAERCCSLSTIVKSLAVGNKSSAQARTSTPQTGPIEISTQELLELTKAISARRPAVEVPEGVLLIIRDVIAGREGCAEWYSAQALKDDGKVARENNGHRHFIEYCFSGFSLAYHSHIDPSVGATALNQQAQLGGEGDLHKIIANTYALPFKRDFLVSLLEKTRLRGINTTAPHLESNPKIMKYYADRNAAGQVEDKTLQQVVKNITGLTLVRLKVPTVVDAMPIPPEREIWVARVPADSGAHAYYLRIVVAAMGPTGTFWKSALADHWLARPLSTLTTPVKEQSYTSDSLRDIESCAYAGLNDISIEQPDELERKVRRAIDAESKSAERPGDVTVVKQTRDTHRSGKGIASKSLVFGPVRPPHLVHEEKQNIAA